jgi:hypothetical protein
MRLSLGFLTLCRQEYANRARLRRGCEHFAAAGIFAARMERSEIRDRRTRIPLTLHAGYKPC